MLQTNAEKEIKDCSFCNNQIQLIKNPNGLVINDEHFICENCCTKTEKPILMRFIKEKSQGASKIRPIMLWSIEKQRKDD